ncbi:MAG: hypothetical protein ACLVHV_16595 [Oscillospiraceae bacterium]
MEYYTGKLLKMEAFFANPKPPGKKRRGEKFRQGKTYIDFSPLLRIK